MKMGMRAMMGLERRILNTAGKRWLSTSAVEPLNQRNRKRTPVRRGRVSPRSVVEDERILRPPYAYSGVDPGSGQKLSLFELGSEELGKMKTACAYARDTLAYAGSLVKPGVTTDEIDRKVFEYVVGRGVYPSPLNYRGFPKSLCSSVNEVLCHGIPDDRELEDGDIVNLDVSTFVDGYHGDTSRTFKVGRVSEEAAHLCDVTEQCLMDCIQACGPGVKLNKVGEICSATSERHGYDVSKPFCGHGIGQTFHMLPYVLHYRNNDPFELRVGMVFTIEPIFAQGSAESIEWDDGWTVATKDESLAAQFEHTVMITSNGCEILT